jgi:NAD(P)-dependent dehydrogenase (short-subunit alcohol dehydrogenase family)
MLEGKVAIVTGAGNGIGREIAIMMAGQGAKVIINDVGASLSGEGLDATPAQQTKAIIAQNGGTSEICTDSVATWVSAQKIVQSAMDHFGRIDIVVNNAGPIATIDQQLAVLDQQLVGNLPVFWLVAVPVRIALLCDNFVLAQLQPAGGLLGAVLVHQALDILDGGRVQHRMRRRHIRFQHIRHQTVSSLSMPVKYGLSYVSSMSAW